MEASENAIKEIYENADAIREMEQTPEIYMVDTEKVPLPDPTTSIDDRNAYGYVSDELLPLSQERAAELFEQDLTVYLLYEDNTEAMAFDRADIDNHSGLFGIEKADWTTHLVPDNFVTGKRIDTQRGSFRLTSMTKEQIKQAGYDYHHSSDDGAFHIMGNGTRAFAVRNEDNPLRTTELSTVTRLEHMPKSLSKSCLAPEHPQQEWKHIANVHQNKSKRRR